MPRKDYSLHIIPFLIGCDNIAVLTEFISLAAASFISRTRYVEGKHNFHSIAVPPELRVPLANRAHSS